MPDDLYGFSVPRSDGSAWRLWDLHGRVVLLVALPALPEPSPQTSGLDRLQQTFAAQGLSVVGIPGPSRETPVHGSELGFPVTAPLVTAGGDPDPLFAWLHATVPGVFGTTSVAGYTKFLVGRDGAAIARFEPAADPKALISAVQQALALPVPPAPPEPVPPSAAEPVAPAEPSAGPTTPVAGTAPAAIAAPDRRTGGNLPVPAPPHDPDADITDAELVELESEVRVDAVADELAAGPVAESSPGADLINFSDELRDMETDARLLEEQRRGNMP